MPAPPTRRRRLARTATLTAAVGTLLVGLLSPASAYADEAPADEISSNITHVAHVPKPDAVRSTNSDLAFTGDYAIGGNYDGFVVYDISEPEDPQIVSEVLCPGGQGDVSVSGDLLYFSVDYPRAGTECGAAAVPTTDPDGFEGIRIFDISDKANPQYVAAVATDCGSHTNTLVPGKDGEHEYIYVSSYSPSAQFPNCQPPHDKISIIEVPVDDPASAELIDAPVLFPDGGNARTSGCHDITVFPSKDVAAGACMGDGILMDISDPASPVVTEVVQDTNFAFWHSATFTNDGKNVVFTDELGGGGAPTCTEEIGPERGADAVYSLDGDGSGADLAFQSYFKIDRHQGGEICVAHNGSLIPVPGQDFFVQSWYTGGVSVIDFNDAANPEEIGYFDIDSRVEDGVQDNNSWSAYYYNGYVYSSDIGRGIDVLKLDDPRLRAAERVRMDEFNPQSQPVYRPGRG
ncbi:hypothetical protein Q8791_30975 [Nocardiopsis sp. CT-R113]|uniref:LVIVD repeat-containing protein n=1 Tax=Nocardiopsis codii TaxID=3065942 RepID=A0ABU7KHH5_9ACTN|nr:hypothetical protein [Nocardiopsis sp. CT-R113]MEE2041653.1 hypothetical protein [Nocardiopsis sp. CT-R113]